jgi:hypothetical protein
MRVASACLLLSLLLSVACARAAPAPFPKSHGRQPMTVDRIDALLQEQGIDALIIEPHGHNEWLIVVRQGAAGTGRGFTPRVYLVRPITGARGGQPRLALQELENHRLRLR